MKKFWKNNKGWVITVAVIVLLVVGTVLSEGVEKANKEPFDVSKASETVQEWYSETQKEKFVVTVLAGSSCQYCANFKPVIEEVAKEEDLDLRWFYIDQQEDVDAEALETLYDLQDTGRVPYMYITYGGELVTYNVGYLDKAALVKLLEENDVL